jgi:hypothetical protein
MKVIFAMLLTVALLPAMQAEEPLLGNKSIEWSGELTGGKPLPASMSDGIPGPVIPDGLGVNVPNFTNPLPGEMEMITNAGVRWIRTDIFWNATEKQAGCYDFSLYTNLLKILAQYHVRPLFILDYGNPVYQPEYAKWNQSFPSSPIARAAFVKWAAAAATACRGYGVIWEMWNEPNYVPAGSYAELAIETGQAIHRADPHALFVGPALWYGNSKQRQEYRQWLAQICRAGVLKEFAAVTVHPYHYRLPPEVNSAIYEQFRTLIAGYAPAGRSVPIICSEWGYSTQDPGLKGNSDQQAEYLARAFLVNLMNDIPISIWYEWRNDFHGSSAEERHFGLVQYDYHPDQRWVFTPNPAFFACRTLTRALHEFHFAERIAAGNTNEFLLEFAVGKQRCWVAWSTADPSAKPDAVCLPVPAGLYDVINYLGSESVTVSATTSGLKLQLSAGPQYIIPHDVGFQTMPVEKEAKSQDEPYQADEKLQGD